MANHKKKDKHPNIEGGSKKGQKSSSENASGASASTGGSRQGNAGHQGDVDGDNSHR